MCVRIRSECAYCSGETDGSETTVNNAMMKMVFVTMRVRLLDQNAKL